MRGIYSNKTEIRHKVFTEIARMAYDDSPLSRIEDLPYEIVPGEIGKYYDNIFLERAIVGERLRATMGLPIRKMSEHAPLSEGIDASAIDEKYYDPPLINIIKFACHACPEKRVFITNACQGCLEHPCIEVCPKDAIKMVKGRSVIDQDKCIKCGKCANACPYNAVVKQERPCAKACGMNAIKSDEYGRADIDYDQCVSCGMCLVSCPFSAIVDKSQIYQTVLALKSETPVYAAIAPSFVRQFGADVTPEMVRAALKVLGFEDMVEVAIGADLCSLQEAEDFLENVPANQKWMGTSCCPAWSVMAKKTLPEYAHYISMSLTPMVLTARMIKKQHPECKVVFIGPCAAKKLEASRHSVRSDVDFVLTFEETMGLFEKIKSGLKKTKDNMVKQVETLINSFTKIDEEFFEELEETLIMSDVGVATSVKICDMEAKPSSLAACSQSSSGKSKPASMPANASVSASQIPSTLAKSVPCS